MLRTRNNFYYRVFVTDGERINLFTTHYTDVLKLLGDKKRIKQAARMAVIVLYQSGPFAVPR